MADLAASVPVTDQAPVDPQQIASVSILLQILMLVLAFVVGHVLRRHKVHYLHEASGALLIGLFAGGLANVSNTEERFRKWFNFHEDFFFFFLLPPIIFESGFSLRPKPFFSNFGAICVFAILGTFVAAMVTGILIWLGGVLYLVYKLTFFESLIFGSIISATDPVTVLAIFQELGIDTNLYALVFGESVLNDAVAMSLYRTLMLARKQPGVSHGVLLIVWRFLETFVGSMSAGVGVGLICALLFKYAGLAVNNLQNLECCLVVLFPYFSYMVAESVGLSGIVSILFCGILMKHYTLPNLSENAQTFTAAFFQLISSLAETFVFIYMGADIAIEKHSWSHVGFIFFSILFIGLARAANVFPCTYLVNMFRPVANQIPMKHQKALWFSGLRGAMAFALALQSRHDLAPGPGRTIFTTTTAIVILTVLLIGGSTSKVLEKLEVTTDESRISVNGEDPEDGDEHFLSYDQERSEVIPTPLQKKFQELRDSTSFTNIDENFLKPFFTTRVEDNHDNSLGSKQSLPNKNNIIHQTPELAAESSRERRDLRSTATATAADASDQNTQQRSTTSVSFKDDRRRHSVGGIGKRLSY